MSKKLVLLCNHVPARDPRIDWVASLASEYFDTTVIGYLPSWDVSSTDDPLDHPYQIHIVKPDETIKMHFRNCRKVGIVLCIRLWYLTVLDALFGVWPRTAFRTVKMAVMRMRAADAKHNNTIDDVAQIQYPTPGYAPRADGIDNLPKSSFWLIRKMRAGYWSISTFFSRKKREVLFKYSCILISIDILPNVVISVDYETLASGIAIKEKYGATLIYDMHEFTPYESEYYSKKKTLELLRSERKQIQNADYAFTVNPILAQEMMKVYPVPILSVPNCVPLASTASSAADDLSFLSHNRVKFLFQGTFSPSRGIEELIHAWAKIDPSCAVLFLRGPQNECRDQCLKLAQQLHILNQSVFFIPAVSEDQLVSACAYADVGIIPYLPVNMNNACCCPNKLSQYMHAGLAILAQDTRYVKDRLETYQNGLIYDVETPGSICDAVMQLVSRPDLLKELKQHSLTAAQDDFNWAVQSMPLRKVLAELA